jgi:hypothetical protein
MKPVYDSHIERMVQIEKETMAIQMYRDWWPWEQWILFQKGHDILFESAILN